MKASKATARSKKTQKLAKLYLERDIAIMPLPPKKKKASLNNWPNSIIGPEDIEGTWSNGQNIAAIMGRRSGNLVTVDHDCPETVALAGRFLDPTATSGHGARLDLHWWFYTNNEAGYQMFKDIDSTTTLLELRGDSEHYTVLPPSEHPSGEVYAFAESGLEIAHVEAEALRHQVRMLATAGLITRHLPNHREDGGGGRHDLALALSGFLLKEGRLDPETVLGILRGSWDTKGWPSEQSRREAHRDLERTVRDTAHKLRDGKKVKGGGEVEKMIPGLASRIADYWDWPDRDKKKQDTQQPSPTHDELRDRWLEANPEYAFGLGEWRRYKNSVWSVTQQPKVEASIVRILEAAKTEGIRPNGFVLSSVHKLAKIEAYIEDERWDNDPNIIIAENGAIDIASGSLLPHSPDYYCTTSVPYAFDSKAEAPNWHRFLTDIDKDVAAFLQEFAGYCLTTDTSLEKAVWLVGPPGGGKSTFLEGLIAMLGARAGVLGLAEIEKSSFALSKLIGKTLVTAAEQPAGFVSCHHILNAIISGERLQVERKYQNPYDIVPRAKIVWAMNETPRIPSGAEGLFRRVEVIKLSEIAKGDRDPTLKEGIKTEGAGVFNWALEGLKKLRKRGVFAVPPKVEQGTEEFRRNNDIPGLFVAEKCIRDPEATEKASDLYREYKFWCEENGHRRQSSTRVADDWQRLGFERYRSMGTSRYRGVRVRLPGE